MNINVPKVLATMLLFASSQCVWADTAKPLVNQKEWDEAVERLSKDSNPKLAANKRLILEAERALAVALRYGGVEETAEKYFTPDYVQNDPNLPPGRDGFVRWFKAGAMQPTPKPGEPLDTTAPPPIMAFATPDMVTLIFETRMPDPADPSKTYAYRPVVAFRIANGKLAEHWGGSPKGAYYCRFGICDSKR
jgi:predicted SnoaL-like aldol condensation-catalyzing enzyme